MGIIALFTSVAIAYDDVGQYMDGGMFPAPAQAPAERPCNTPQCRQGVITPVTPQMDNNQSTSAPVITAPAAPSRPAAVRTQPAQTKAPQSQNAEPPVDQTTATSNSACAQHCRENPTQGEKLSTCISRCYDEADGFNGPPAPSAEELCDRKNPSAQPYVYTWHNGQCVLYHPDCESKSQAATDTCVNNEGLGAFSKDADKAAKAFSMAQQSGMVDSCSEMRKVAAGGNTALLAFKAQCEQASSSCSSVCDRDQITTNKNCKKALEATKGADFNAVQAVTNYQDSQCDMLQKALSKMGGMGGGGSGIQYNAPTSSLAGLKPGSGSASFGSSSPVGDAGASGKTSTRGLGATDLGSLMGGGEDPEFGGSQVQAGKAAQGGGGGGLGGGGGGLGPKNQNQKGGQQAANKGLNWGKGYMGGGSGPGFGGGPGGNGDPSQGGGNKVGGQPGVNGGPDWRKFLPGGQYDPRRGIAGVTGPDGITGPATDLFGKVHNRYGAVGHTLKP